MANPAELADYALSLARRAADDLAAQAAARQADLDDVERPLLGSVLPDDATGHLRRETWERFVALQLVLAAKCIARDQPPSKEESDDPARESGRPPLLSDHEGWQALAAGDIDSAELHAHEMLAAADAQGSDEAPPDDERHRAHVLLGYVCLRRNDLDGAEAELLRSSEVEATPVVGLQADAGIEKIHLGISALVTIIGARRQPGRTM